MECQPKLCKKTQLFCIASQVLKVMLLWKAVSHSYLTTSSFISCSSFYISSLSSFLQIFRTFFTIIWKKIFITNFPFLTDSLKRPLLPDLNPLKRDKSFLLMLPKLLWHILLSDFVDFSRYVSKFWKPTQIVIIAN